MDKTIKLKLRNCGEDVSSFYNTLINSSKYLISDLSDDKRELEVVIASEKDLVDLSEFVFMDFAYNFCDKIVSNYFIDKNYIGKIEDTLMMNEADLKNNREYLLFKSVQKASSDNRFREETMADIIEQLKLHIEEYNILELEGFQNFRLGKYKYYFLGLISRTYDEMMGKEVSELLEKLISNTRVEMEGVLEDGNENMEDQ